MGGDAGLVLWSWLLLRETFDLRTEDHPRGYGIV